MIFPNIILDGSFMKRVMFLSQISGGVEKYFDDYNVFGDSVQTGTPTPANPITINSTGEKEGKLILNSGGANTEIPLTLKRLPSGIRDDLNYRNVGQVIINGTEAWNNVQESTGNTNYYFCFTAAIDSLIKVQASSTENAKNFMCTHFVPRDSMLVSTNVGTTESMTIQFGGAQRLRFMILKSRVDAMTGTTLMDKWINWLKLNPVTIQYEMATPVAQGITKPQIRDYGNPITSLNEMQPSLITYVRDGATYSSDGLMKSETLQSGYTYLLDGQENKIMDGNGDYVAVKGV